MNIYKLIDLFSIKISKSNYGIAISFIISFFITMGMIMHPAIGLLGTKTGPNTFLEIIGTLAVCSTIGFILTLSCLVSLVVASQVIDNLRIAIQRYFCFYDYDFNSPPVSGPVTNNVEYIAYSSLLWVECFVALNVEPTSDGLCILIGTPIVYIWFIRMFVGILSAICDLIYIYIRNKKETEY